MNKQLIAQTMVFIFCWTSFAFAQSVLFEGPASLPVAPSDPPASGPGIRMMWYPDKAAFRVGKISNTQWDKINIGQESMAWGRDNISMGDFSTSWGTNNKAIDHGTTIWGNSNYAKGFFSTVWGAANEARAVYASVWGLYNIGKSYLETVVGQYNDTLTSSNQFLFIDSDYLFVIGNGSDLNNRSNAFEVYKNGNTVIKGALNLTKDLNIGGVLSLADSLKVNGPVFLTNNTTIEGALTLKNGTETITSDNQLVTVGNRGYIRVTSNVPGIPTMRTIILSSGGAVGQILFLECSGNAWELLDSGTANLNSDRNLSSGDIIQLMWNGTKWLEVQFSDN